MWQYNVKPGGFSSGEPRDVAVSIDWGSIPWVSFSEEPGP